MANIRTMSFDAVIVGGGEIARLRHVAAVRRAEEMQVAIGDRGNPLHIVEAHAGMVK